MSTRPSKDRASLCLFAFKDGRRCRMLRAADPYLCNYHARREAERMAPQRVGRNIAASFSGEYISASSLALALARTLAATAQGQLKPKQAALIACLGRTLMQAIQHAQHEYTESFGPNAWREAIRTCFDPPVESPRPGPPSAASPTPPSAANPTSPKTAPQSPAANPASSELLPQSPAANPAQPGLEEQSLSPGKSNPSPVANAKRKPQSPASPAGRANPQPTAAKSPLPNNPSAFADQVLAQLKH